MKHFTAQKCSLLQLEWVAHGVRLSNDRGGVISAAVVTAAVVVTAAGVVVTVVTVVVVGVGVVIGAVLVTAVAVSVTAVAVLVTAAVVLGQLRQEAHAFHVHLVSQTCCNNTHHLGHTVWLGLGPGSGLGSG